MLKVQKNNKRGVPADCHIYSLCDEDANGCISPKKKKKTSGSITHNHPTGQEKVLHTKKCNVTKSDMIYTCEDISRQLVVQRMFPPEKDYWSNLSDEIALNILKWLPKSMLAVCARVCKRWRNLCCDDSLWKRMDLGRCRIAPGTLGTVLNRGVVVLRLAMAVVRNPVFYPPVIEMGRFSKLQYLDLSLASISGEDLSLLLSACCVLKNISLESCSVNDDVCRHLAVNSSLEVLNMSMCSGLTANALSDICNGCLQLKEWNLAWTNLRVDSVKVLTQHIPVGLQRLNISGFRCLTDKGFSQIVSRCPNLLELDISDNSVLTDASMEVIVQKLHVLEHLWCCRCYKISPAAYVHLGKIESLKRLSMFHNMVDEAEKYLKNILPSVEVNQHRISTVARPTTGIRRTSIWGLRVRE